jgi:ribosomal protein S18 acetylase RimI-like enzyme
MLIVSNAERADLPVILQLQYEAYQSEAEIDKLIVKPTFQNRGIGKRLMQEIEQAYPRVKRKELFTGHKSEKNLRFYENLGYRPYKETEVNERLKLIYMYKED